MFSKKFALAAGVAITAVALTGAAAFPAFAHHAAPSVMFSPDTEVVLTGTVKEFRYSNPHGSLELLVPRGGQNVRHAHSLASVIIGHLITVYLTEGEIARCRVREVEPAHTRTRPHCKGFREQHPGVGLNIQQTPERPLLGVIRTRRVTRRWPDAAGSSPPPGPGPPGCDPWAAFREGAAPYG